MKYTQFRSNHRPKKVQNGLNPLCPERFRRRQAENISWLMALCSATGIEDHRFLHGLLNSPLRGKQREKEKRGYGPQKPFHDKKIR